MIQTLAQTFYLCGVILMSSENKQLAIREAAAQECDVNIVLATVEAETDFNNIKGDNGNALGFGQVWPQWHRYAFDYAGKRLNIPVPSNMTDLTALTLSDNTFSMIVAVKVIKGVWLSSGKDWRKFTLSYVGSGIPEWDYNRRLAIWNKYNNGNESISYNTNTAFGINNVKASDAVTNGVRYGVVPNSFRSKGVLYGRRYRVLVSNAQGTALDVSDLRCTFSVVKTLEIQPSLSELTIYNLNADTENRLIQEGNKIVVEAGYEGEQYGVVFEGDVVQPIRDKEDGVTYKLTLISLDGDRFYCNGFTDITLQKGITAREAIENITNKATNPIKFGSISENLSDAKLTRGKVVFGLARDYLREIAQSQNAISYIENNKVNVVKLDDPVDEIIDLSPSSGLIGTPAQNENGLSAKCLLNPRITTNKLIRIDNSLIRQARYQPNYFTDPGKTPTPGTIPKALDKDGIYRVIKVTYKGDTRGDDWYCEIEALNQSGKLPEIATKPETNAT